ncbi:type II secretion system major pseudopilin GspG [Thermomonas aquatica]|jgi:general secretion pathway protein G|uniref:Type II secretion system core protein G n=1 Tax=Thermomonas aquatica TaxID=2202149 RepID=A0A5B7ZNX2_9GAMM|nr:type II secretion system major pseudopilin GspG [Thermomonas aquatica]QDA56901.1 type II secretion system protein GspG [Thermomonas aquatica]
MRNRQFRPVPHASQGGFSLIEIILVVVLIGGIVAFAATRILGGGDRAKVNLAKAQVQTLAEKVGQFQQDTGSLPGSLDDLVKSSATGWLGPYAKQSELKDPWNHPYTYAMPGEGKPFDLASLGADGQAGGDSVNADIKYE